MHHAFIRRCLELAQNGRGNVGINPMVGTVLVRGGKVIAEAWHQQFGGPHAERVLLEHYSGEIHQDDVLYVNLEPCCHRNKKTPPCTDIIIQRGVKRVVFGMIDPNPEVLGKGIEQLHAAAIEMIGPVERTACEWLNRGFASLQNLGRPWITLKRAQTANGVVAHPDASPMKITNEQQDRWSHEHLRAKHDAILVGVGTIIRDNPQLTVRNVNNNSDQFNPLRIVLDPNSKISEDSRIMSKQMASGTILVTRDSEESKDSEDSEEKMLKLEQQGVRIFKVATDDSGQFVWPELWKILTSPQDQFFGISSLLVEGGIKTWASFKGAAMFDADVTLVGKA